MAVLVDMDDLAAFLADPPVPLDPVVFEPVKWFISEEGTVLPRRVHFRGACPRMPTGSVVTAVEAPLTQPPAGELCNTCVSPTSLDTEPTRYLEVLDWVLQRLDMAADALGAAEGGSGPGQAIQVVRAASSLTVAARAARDVPDDGAVRSLVVDKAAVVASWRARVAPTISSLLRYSAVQGWGRTSTFPGEESLPLFHDTYLAHTLRVKYLNEAYEGRDAVEAMASGLADAVSRRSNPCEHDVDAIAATWARFADAHVEAAADEVVLFGPGRPLLEDTSLLHSESIEVEAAMVLWWFYVGSSERPSFTRLPRAAVQAMLAEELISEHGAAVLGAASSADTDEVYATAATLVTDAAMAPEDALEFARLSFEPVL